MKEYKVIETIIYYVQAESEEQAWKVFEDSNFDKADALKVYRELKDFN